MNATDTEEQQKKRREAILHTAEKLILERQLYKTMKRFFSSIRHAIFSERRLHAMKKYSDHLNIILEDHYRKAQKKFDMFRNGDIKQYQSLGNNILHDTNILTQKKITEFINENSTQSSKHIIQTTNNRIQNKLEQNDNNYDKAGEEFENDSDYHSHTVAITETCKSSEGIKHICFTSLMSTCHSHYIKPELRDIRKNKMWSAILDNRTRPWHREANKQVVPYNQPFYVHEEELMYPGDTSLGATSSNIANCRCCCTYNI